MKASEYARRVLQVSPLALPEFVGERIPIGDGRESCLVRVNCAGQVIVIAVVVEPNGAIEALHHTRMAA
jgi:hypothetical protein